MPEQLLPFQPPPLPGPYLSTPWLTPESPTAGPCPESRRQRCFSASPVPSSAPLLEPQSPKPRLEDGRCTLKLGSLGISPTSHRSPPTRPRDWGGGSPRGLACRSCSSGTLPPPSNPCPGPPPPPPAPGTAPPRWGSRAWRTPAGQPEAGEWRGSPPRLHASVSPAPAPPHT